MSDVQTFLRETLPHTVPDFRANPVQQAYARSAAKALRMGQGRIHFIEAGTGVGKSLAYLCAAAEWHASAAPRTRRRIVISTFSRALQRQLMDPANQALVNQFRHALGAPDLTFALRMGRANYVNPDRVAWLLEAGVDASALPEAAADSQRPPDERALAQWTIDNPGGCLLDLDADTLPPSIRLADICLASQDTLPDALEQQLARSHGADVLIVNHALVVRDLVGHGNTLDLVNPDDELLLILDEGEHVPDVAEDALAVGLPINTVVRTAARLGYTRTADRWTELFDRLCNPAFADRAATLLDSHHADALHDALKAVTRSRAVDEDLSPEHALWNDVRERARTLARRIREQDRGLTISYSPKYGYPRLSGLAPNGGRILKNGMNNRITVLTSATLSDMQSNVGATSFNYLRTRIQLRRDDPRIGMQDAHEPQHFGQLSFRLLEDLGHPLIEDNDAMVLSPTYARGLITAILAPTPGRTLVLCPSYRDVRAIELLWPDRARGRLVMPPQGAALNDVAVSMDHKGILLTPAGWEGLSPARNGRPFWSRVVVVRNPRQPNNPAAILALANAIAEQSNLSRVQARKRASGIINAQAQTKTLHKLRQGIGRALRHPDDTAEIVIADPRFIGRTRETGEIGGMASAIPPRFQADYLVAAVPNAVEPLIL